MPKVSIIVLVKHFKMPKRISKKHMIYLLLMKYSLVGIILRV